VTALLLRRIMLQAGTPGCPPTLLLSPLLPFILLLLLHYWASIVDMRFT
jgi:hypothetical protein